jgi:hypothetical protein
VFHRRCYGCQLGALRTDHIRRSPPRKERNHRWKADLTGLVQGLPLARKARELSCKFRRALIGFETRSYDNERHDAALHSPIRAYLIRVYRRHLLVFTSNEKTLIKHNSIHATRGPQFSNPSQTNIVSNHSGGLRIVSLALKRSQE